MIGRGETGKDLMLSVGGEYGSGPMGISGA